MTKQTYVVTSTNFAGGALGAVLTEVELGNCNIPALVEAGHLSAQTPNGAVKADSTKEQ